MRDRSRIAVAIVMALYVVWAAAFIRVSSVPMPDGTRAYCLFDDAMISMRYAENVVRGRGLVWNEGERVEGYTNPLMVAVMAAFLLVLPKAWAVLGIQLLGIALMLGTALLCLRIYDRISHPPLRAPPWLVMAAVLAIYTLSFWSLLGMETGLIALLTACAAATAVSRDDTDRRIGLIAWLTGLLYLCRPDALLIGLTLGAPLVLSTTSRRFRSASRLLLPCITIAAAHLAFRLAYYGELLPNTFTLKLADVPLRVRLHDGGVFLGPFLEGIIPLVGLALYGMAHTPSRSRLMLAAPMAGLVLYQWYVGGEPWAYWRIMGPALPLMAALACDGATLLAARALPTPTQVRVTALVIAAMAWAMAIHNKPFLTEALLLTPFQEAVLNRDRVLAGYALREVTLPAATVAVVGAGAIPFYAERRGVDMLGKCDRDIARLKPDLSGSVSWYGMTTIPGHNKYDLYRSIIERKPTYVETPRWGRHDLTAWVRQRYVQVTYNGARLWLLRGSPDVRWEMLRGPSGAVTGE